MVKYWAEMMVDATEQKWADSRVYRTVVELAALMDVAMAALLVA
jgi:hypothetical protein